MTNLELLLIGVGLSMDAFAVAVCKGLGMRRINYRHMLIIALFFGGFQALMPFLGWLLGSRFAQYITRYDHWIAFLLLLFIGGKMIWDTLHEGDKEQDFTDSSLDLKELLLMAIATSIDAGDGHHICLPFRQDWKSVGHHWLHHLCYFGHWGLYRKPLWRKV